MTEKINNQSINKLFPILHWISTVIIANVYLFLESNIVLNTETMKFFGLIILTISLVSLPTLFFYYIVFGFTSYNSFSNLTYKIILNMFIIMMISISYFIVNWIFPLSPNYIIIFSIASVISSLFYKVRLPIKEEGEENIVKENI